MLYLVAVPAIVVASLGSKVLSQQPQTPDAAFCSSLTAMIRAGGDNFRSIRGAPDPDSHGSSWASTLSLPGSTECDVLASEGGPSVNCDFRESAAEDDLETGYATIVRLATKCLVRWSRTDENGRRHLVKGTEFAKASMTVRVEIVEKTSRRRPGFQLTIWIDKDTDNG
jgi:hypothetical protein